MNSMGLALLTASRKSFSVTVFRRARMAYMPASVHTLLMSAPVEFGHSLHAVALSGTVHDPIYGSSCSDVHAGTQPFTALMQRQEDKPQHARHKPRSEAASQAQQQLLQSPSDATAEIGGMHCLLLSDRKPKPACLARSSNRISRSQFMVRVWIWKICVRDSKSGSPNSTFLSRRPGRSNAGSRVSGLFVAISTCNIAQHNIFNPYMQRTAQHLHVQSSMLRTLFRPLLEANQNPVCNY